MRVLFDGRVCCDRFTGVGRYAFGLIRHLGPAFPEIEFTVAWNEHLPNRRFDWGAVRGPGNVTLAPCAGSGLGLLDSLPLHSIARRIRPDFLQAPYFTSAVLSPVRTVVTIHDLTPFTAGHDRWRHGVARWGIRKAARSASFVITPTEAVRGQVIDRLGVNPARIVSIPEGVEPLPDGPLHDPEIAASPYVLFVGVHKPHKNLAGLLDAMALAFPQGEVRLVLAGIPSAFTAELRRRAASLGILQRVVFTGPLDDSQLGALYRGASALALVSFEEGFGLPLAEAMSMRVPVVASDLPVLREVCGEAALYADPRSPSSIAAALTEALARRNGAAARLDHGVRRAAALSWPSLAPRYAVCYGNAENA
ncbi:MAG TPA: glycosyltransferase family 1 protein [Candidatus Dormibacteraeota bacterium]|nr:glycosyltransferase family 1 protein [Candidatus Dormibacteraeota bacterium]